MFRKNDNHKQQDLFNSTIYFVKLMKNPFAVLYSENLGRPNFPVNILVALEIIKHFRDYTDEELIEEFFFSF